MKLLQKYLNLDDSFRSCLSLRLQMAPVTKIKLLIDSNKIPVEVEIQECKWRQIGHTLWNDANEICREAVDWNSEGGDLEAPGGVALKGKCMPSITRCHSCKSNQ